MIEKIDIDKSSVKDIAQKVNEIIDFINGCTQAEIYVLEAELKFLERNKNIHKMENFYGKFL